MVRLVKKIESEGRAHPWQDGEEGDTRQNAVGVGIVPTSRLFCVFRPDAPIVKV